MASTDPTPTQEAATKKEPQENEHADAEKNFNLKSPKFWSIIVSLYISLFLVALDRLIIATAIPSITDDFHSIEDIGWYGSAYLLTGAIFNPLFGRIYKLYSTKWTFIVSMIVFEIGSALCGAAPDSTSFIVGRAIAGIGGAGLFNGCFMIIIPLVPLRKRPMFTSFFGMAFGVASVLGPIVGGAFTDNSDLTWRWCFYINLPIGGVVIAAMVLFLHLDEQSRDQLSLFEQFKALDPLGLLFFTPSMICLILALQWGGTTYPWSEPKVIGLFVTFGVTLILFLAVEVWKPETAMAPTRVVLNRSVGGAMLFVLLLMGSMMIIFYYLTIWFQAAQGQSAIDAGIRTIPIVLSMVVFGIVAATITQKIGYYVPAMLVAPVLCAVGAGMLTTLKPDAGAGEWIGYQVLYGLGIGAGFQTATLAPQAALPRADVSMGMAMIAFTQQLGGAIFVAAGQSIFTSQLIQNLSGIAGLDTEAIVNTGATALRKMVPTSELRAVISAYSYALTRTFILSTALSAAMILGALIMEWKNIKKDEGESSKGSEVDQEEGKSEIVEIEHQVSK